MGSEKLEDNSPPVSSDEESAEIELNSISIKSKKDFKNINMEQIYETSLDFKKYPRKLGYKTVHNLVWTTFFTEQNYYSSVFDIISSYIKAQKVLYLEARSYSVFYLNCLMLPAIFLSSLASVLSLAIENYTYGGVILAGVNAFNSFLLAVINYSKLDAASEAHKTSAHQYDKLQSMCEFTSGKILLLPGCIKKNTGDDDDDDETYNLLKDEPEDISRANKKENQDINEKLDYIENKVTEIKETNTFILPAEVIKRLPKTYHTNIFSKIKDYLKNEIVTINKIKDLLNELRPLEYQVRVLQNDDEDIITRIKIIKRHIAIKTDYLIETSNENRKIEEDFLKK